MTAVAEPLPDLLRLSPRQQMAIDCAVCGRRLGVHVRLLGEVADGHGHLLLLAACTPRCAEPTPGPADATLLIRPVPPGPRTPRPPSRPPAGPWRSRCGDLPRWPVSDPTPPIWQQATAHDAATMRRVLAGLRRLDGGRAPPAAP